MNKVMILALVGAGLFGAAPSAFAQDSAAQPSNQEFIGVDLDNGGVYYNGRNSGRYCLYRTVEVFNRYTGYVEARRVRRCGRGLYLP
ncbi:Secreted protein [Methylorubrum aminovorans]